MATGLIALLDDVAGLAKVAAASLDDVTAHAAKTGAKAARVVIDDVAAAPRCALHQALASATYVAQHGRTAADRPAVPLRGVSSRRGSACT